MKRGIVIAFTLLFISTNANAFLSKFEEKSARIFYGTSQLSFTGTSPDDNQFYRWFSVSYLLEKKINTWLTLQKSIGVDYLFSNHESSPSLTGRIAVDLHKKYLYFNINGGVAYLFSHGELPGLADSLLYSVVGAEIGVKIIDNDTTKLKVAYFTDHMSSPFHAKDDPGWNVGGMAVQVIIKF